MKRSRQEDIDKKFVELEKMAKEATLAASLRALTDQKLTLFVAARTPSESEAHLAVQAAQPFLVMVPELSKQVGMDVSVPSVTPAEPVPGGGTDTTGQPVPVPDDGTGQPKPPEPPKGKNGTADLVFFHCAIIT